MDRPPSCLRTGRALVGYRQSIAPSLIGRDPVLIKYKLT